MRKALVAGCLVLGCGSALAQPPDASLTFEVASVKRVLNVPPGGYPPQMRGGPGTSDPGQIRYVNVALKTLLLNAYGITTFQLSGPDWLQTELYEIAAKIPMGTTKAQFNIMLQNLLKERFNLGLHHETRDAAVYELGVAKNGPKLQHAADAPSELPSGGQMRPDKDGYYDLPPGRPAFIGVGNPMRFSARMQTMEDLANQLGKIVSRLVLDKTGLTGKYDYKLGFSRIGLPITGASDPDTPEADLFKALQDQLGLQLESKKEPLDFLIVDHAEKIPTDN